jgi:hypothetical protein
MERLREYSGAPIDPATSRGTLTAQVTLALPLKEDLAPGSSIYTINLDIANFVAERMVMNQKVEAALLKVSANNQGHWIRGDVKINGVPAALDYRKPRDADADVRIQATLDEADAASSASISAASSWGRCRSSSADAFRRRRATPASRSRPI